MGLFGTVWGIMNSFIGISKSQTTNLAVVAPGIAEALLATAFGLAAAIPAVVIYNVFARSISGYRALLGDASAEVLRLVSRDLDRPAAATHAQRGSIADLGRVSEAQLQAPPKSQRSPPPMARRAFRRSVDVRGIRRAMPHLSKTFFTQLPDTAL